MKIGLVCPYDIHRYGGVQEHVLAQAVELKRRGHEVTVLTPKPRKQPISKVNKVKVVHIGNSTNLKMPIRTSLELGVSLKRDAVDDILESEAFDLLHIHEPEVPFLGAQIVSKSICPIVATFHAIHPKTPVAKTIETMRIPYSRSIFSRLAEITAVSDTAASFVKQRTGREVKIIPNGIDTTKYKFITDRKNNQTILYIGRLEKRKGVIYLIKAFDKVFRENARAKLVIAGDGNLRSGLEKYVEDKHIQGVSFLGFVEESKKMDLLRQSTVFCSPAVYGESFGIVLLEAIASGIPVVAGDNPGYTSVLKETGRIGIVNPKDTKSFALTLSLLLEDEKIRRDWQEWASAYIKQFDYPKIVDQYEALYKKALSKK